MHVLRADLAGITTVPTEPPLGWGGDRLRVIIAGDLEPDRMLTRLESLLGSLPPQTAGPLPTPASARVPVGIVSETMTRQQNQSVVLVAWPGPMDTETDRVPLMLLKEVLNGQSGRLFETLRNRQSLCYNTGTMSTARATPPPRAER